ncbi:lipoprotein [uncultured Photobacterium sp.]|uniref:lipoprotein n=1 Tax=uncultured Photobacterium sp. TaxID=173973 RepID=UPI002615A5AF|nr:lipoprotein [uncultured Photobacterium sp.]
MKKITLLLLSAFILSGCVTRKVPVKPEARTVTAISEIGVQQLNCQIVGTHTIDDAHPNNVERELKNEAYMAGGNRYRIVAVLDTHRSRPSSVVAELYNCPSPYKAKPAGNVELLPGAYSVKPITFTEIENNECKILNTHVVEKTSPDNLEIELSNETYMMGGNRFHITKIIDSNGNKPTSVVADIYRCKHTTVAY